MDLKDILPENPTFVLAATGREYELRPPNVSDRAWLRDHFPDEEELRQACTNRDWRRLGPFVYRLMVDKSDFLAKDVEFVTDEGELVTRRKPGPERLLEAIATMDDEMNVLRALSRAITLSNPVVKEYIEAEVKKKALELAEQIGEPSLTVSQPPTDGPRSTSPPEH